MEELIGFVIVLLVRVLDGIMGLIGLLHFGERHIAENSRVGESPLEQKSRHWWGHVFNRWFWISMVLLGIAAALGYHASW